MDSGLELAMASEMASVLSDMVTAMVLELEQASGVLSESKLIGHVCLKENHAV
jgi:hypothetical protein